MASTSRTLMLLGFLVASFCVSANAGRDLAETSKLDLGGLTGSLATLLKGLKLGPIQLTVIIDATEVYSPILVAVEGVDGVPIDLAVVTGIVNKLRATISVKAEKLLVLTVTINGEERTIDVPLADVLTVVTNVLTMVLNLVETITDGVSVLTITGALGQVITGITTGVAGVAP